MHTPSLLTLLLLTTPTLTSTLIKRASSQCQCGFRVPPSTQKPLSGDEPPASEDPTTSYPFTELQEIDFRRTKLIGPGSDAGWQVQEYMVDADDTNAWAKNATRGNVKLHGEEGMQLIVSPGIPQKDNSSTGIVNTGEIVSVRSDVMYGSFRAGIRFTSVNGTCGAFFWYRNNTREIDMESLSASPSNMNLVIHSDESASSGFDAAHSRSYSREALKINPTKEVHEYRFDWFPTHVDFFVDGVPIKRMTENIPTGGAGHLTFNHWSNGNPGWSMGPPEEEAVMQVVYFKAYFNSTDAERKDKYKKRCEGKLKSDEVTAQVCEVPVGLEVGKAPDLKTVPFVADEAGKADGQVGYPDAVPNKAGERLEVARWVAILGLLLGLMVSS